MPLWIWRRSCGVFRVMALLDWPEKPGASCEIARGPGFFDRAFAKIYPEGLVNRDRRRRCL